ncbi:hypothetical protein [Streptomyces sp. RTd22]|uniref:hypothetical protein n=1 Tax=Streptomyces sp. RTd22 TaxID=1841249 RepID=UPI0007C47D93|nr:hypothetical protein [Streptomyces sp. RTd22]
MFRPKYPEAPVPSTAPAGQHSHAPACSCQHASAAAPAQQTPWLGPTARTVGAVLAVGVVVTALLAAVVVTAISVAVAAVVMRSLLTSQRHR